ncbi:hypothetical protein J6590_073758 [Homalodisca vitripennis]|nr:hypothetical protein J6590_073758 [Homalodisca vitripennis]
MDSLFQSLRSGYVQFSCVSNSSIKRIHTRGGRHSVLEFSAEQSGTTEGGELGPPRPVSSAQVKGVASPVYSVPLGVTDPAVRDHRGRGVRPTATFILGAGQGSGQPGVFCTSGGMPINITPRYLILSLWVTDPAVRDHRGRGVRPTATCILGAGQGSGQPGVFCTSGGMPINITPRYLILSLWVTDPAVREHRGRGVRPTATCILWRRSREWLPEPLHSVPDREMLLPSILVLVALSGAGRSSPLEPQTVVAQPLPETQVLEETKETLPEQPREPPSPTRDARAFDNEVNQKLMTPASEETLMTKLNAKCSQRDTSSCLMLKLVTYMNRLLKKSSIGVGDSLVITQTSAVVQEESPLSRSLQQDASEESQLGMLVANKLWNFVRSRSIKWSVLPEADLVMSASPDDEGTLKLGMNIRAGKALETGKQYSHMEVIFQLSKFTNTCLIPIALQSTPSPLRTKTIISSRKEITGKWNSSKLGETEEGWYLGFSHVPESPPTPRRAGDLGQAQFRGVSHGLTGAQISSQFHEIMAKAWRSANRGMG